MEISWVDKTSVSKEYNLYHIEKQIVINNLNILRQSLNNHDKEEL